MWKEASYYARMLGGFARLGTARPLASPEAAIRANLENREKNFLAQLETILQNPANPYNGLFKHAGCELGDLQDSLRTDGLDATLERLRAEGVYLSHDEFKGKKPIERGRFQAQATPSTFANPRIKAATETTSSASRSQGTVTRHSVDFQVYRDAQDALFLSDFALETRAITCVLPILPSTVGLYRMLSFDRRGTPIHKWFSLGGNASDSIHYQAVTWAIVAECKLLGRQVPWPTLIDRNDFAPVARWIEAEKKRGRAALWMGPVSLGVRVAAAALEEGIDIAGTLFLCGAEPLTPARREEMEKAGGIVYSRYGASEIGWVGCCCPEMREGSCVHVMRDSIGVISHRKKAPLTDVEVNSLFCTTLLPSASYVLVNMEMADSAVLEPATCGCRFTAMGFTQQLRDIYSYGKLTGFGITLLSGDLLSIFERSLPSRFGGTPTDYQLIELDGTDTAIVELRVNPRLAVRSEDDVRAFFLDEVKRLWGGSMTVRQWGQAGAVRIAFQEPVISGDRKINPLHLLSGGAARR